MTDPRLKVTDYDHNAVGELVRIAGEEGVEQRFGYDANGSLVRSETHNRDEAGMVQSPEWIVRTCQYDAWNRMTSCTEDVVGSTTRTTAYEYDFLGNLSKVTTPEGRVQTFEYDERGVMWRQVRGVGTPLASTRTWHVDKNGNVIQSIDGRGGLTTIERDLFDRAQAIVDPAGNRTELVLSARDEVLQRELFDLTNPSVPMARSLQQFDELGRLIRSTADPVSGSHPQSVTWFERDKTGLATRVRSPREAFTVYGYDGAGRLESVVDHLGNEIQYSLDGNGNPEVVTSIEQVSGGTESYALETLFDGQNRPTVRRRYAQGIAVGSGTPLVTSFGWDSRNQLALVTNPIGRVMRTAYDLAGRPTSTKEDETGLVLTTGYAHDRDDLMTTLTDPDGKVTGWLHDDLGRVREIDYAAGGSELFTHDGEDAVKTHTRQDGVATTLTYRADGALSSRTVGALREEFDWAAVGVPREARVLVSGLVRSRVSRTFDGLGRVASESQDSYTVTLGYDPSHNPTSIQWPDGYTLDQDFDELERLARIHEGPTNVAEWAWSGPGRVASRSTGQSLGLVTTYQWDPFQRLAGLDTGAVHDVAYGYDNLDRRCWKQSQHLAGQPIDVFGYDGGSRLVDVWADAGAAVCAQAPSTWSSHLDLTLTPGEDRDQTALDSGGGPVTTDYNPAGIDALHRYIKVGTNGPTRVHDDKGNLTSDGTLAYAYDAWNRLVSVTHIATQSERARYEHDALGRRTRKIEPNLVTEYVYSGARLIAEYEDTGSGPVLARRYLHGVGLDELVALDSGASRYFAFGDALGSVEALATGTGPVAEWYRYDAFGSATVMDGNEVGFPLNGYGQPQSPLNNALWFTGARYDGESGHYHMRARQYEPSTGRFVSRDPLGYVDSANAYLYGFNDPANWVDPFGLEAQSGPKRAWYQHAGDLLYGGALGLKDVGAGMIDALVVAPIDTVVMLASDEYVPMSNYSQHVGTQLAAGESANMIGAKAAGSIIAAPVLAPWHAGWAIGEGTNAGDFQQIGRGLGHLGGAILVAKGAEALGRSRQGAGASSAGSRATSGARALVEPARPGQVAEAVSGRNCPTANPFEVAQSGGRNAGLLRNYAERSAAEIQKGIASLERQAALHAEKVANPAQFAERWGQMSTQEQAGLIKYWQKEVARYQEQAAVLYGLLGEL